jgi:tryptophan halogenase
MKNKKHLCIVGTGAAGWLACNLFKTKDYIEKITIVGSDEIPPIGVGESNTLKLVHLHSKFDLDTHDFIRETDAAIKYGVYYNNWSKTNFLHFFKGTKPFEKIGMPEIIFGKSLGSKPTDKPIEEYFGKNITKIVLENNLLDDPEEFYPLSWHFDAGKYINYLSKLAIKNQKVTQITDTVVDCVFDNDAIQSIVLKSNRVIEADYFVFASGQSMLIKNILKEEYEDLSDVLLTNKAVIYPLEYTDKKKQFHPYTVAKTMKHGWRWITPTYSRIGTGYVFSNNHISEDEAVEEFITDIGDKSISPKVVDFTPQYNKKTFKKNYCTIGMLNGFVEPLDAPGLSLTGEVLIKLDHYFSYQNLGEEIINSHLSHMNNYMKDMYQFWASFILCQYKTCHRNDSNFWKDHKNVHYHPYENLMNNLNNYNLFNNSMMMFYHTLAGKDYRWGDDDLSLFKFDDASVIAGENHLDFIQMFHK